MRAIAFVAAVFLVFVAAASGSRQMGPTAGVTQKALEAPLPTDADRRAGSLVSHVMCPSAAACVAFGGYRTSQQSQTLVLLGRRGRWTAQRQTVPLGFLVAACPSVGRCVGARGGERNGYVVSQKGRSWSSSLVQLPDGSADTWPAVGSVSCGSVGNCTAVGSYENPLLTPLVVTESAGTWAAGTAAQLPPNAATQRNPAYTSAGGSLSLVSCPSSGNCTAVGTYTNKDAQYSQYGWLLNEKGGSWGPGAMARLPGDARIFGDSERGGTSPFFGFTGLSCPSTGNCTAVGGYWGQVDVQNGVIFRERNGTWSRGAKAPVPANAGPNNSGSNEFSNPLTAVSCAAPDSCAAIGWYVDKSRRTRGLLLSERSGKWKASELVLPAGTPRVANEALNSVTCSSPGNCVAVGETTSFRKTRGLIVVERNGVWGRGIATAPPRNARRKGYFLGDVACASAHSCTAVGSFADHSGVAQGLLLDLRLR